MALVSCPDCENKKLSDSAASCPDCSRPNTTRRVEESWRFSYVWQWYQSHVQHRTTMLNYVLLSTGILANAYVGLLKDSRFVAAGWLASFGAGLAYAFLCLDVITLRKIQLAKTVLRRLNRPTDRTAEVEPDEQDFALILTNSNRTKHWLRRLPIGRDRWWTFFIETGITLAAVLAAAYALHSSDLTRWLLCVGVAVFVLPLLIATLAKSPQ